MCEVLRMVLDTEAFDTVANFTLSFDFYLAYIVFQLIITATL